MKAITHKNRLQQVVAITAVFFSIVMSGVTQAEESAIKLALLDTPNNWQNNRLFNPTQKQREKEQRGQILIYDSLLDVTVDAALDKNFDRIESMMFTHVTVTDSRGQPKLNAAGKKIYEDDGC